MRLSWKRFNTGEEQLLKGIRELCEIPDLKEQAAKRMQLGVVVHANNPQYLVAEAEGLQI
jgi:hypothetical protein